MYHFFFVTIRDEMGLFSASDRHRNNSPAALLAVLFCGMSVLFAENNLSFYETLQQEHDNEGRTVFRSLLIPSGGKAEAMGSAFTGLSNDIGFFEYNPAASSLLTETEAAAFHNMWIADSSVETIAFTQRSKDLGYGIMAKCFYVPFTEYDFFGKELNKSYYTESAVTLNTSYNFFHGYTFKGLALGANIKGALRTVPDYSGDDSATIVKNSGLSQSAIAFLADAGMMIRFNFLKWFDSRTPNMSLGFSATNFGVALTGLPKNGFKPAEALPSKFSAGFSWQMIQPITITAEFQKPINLLNPKESEHWAAGVGIDLQFTSFFAVQGGFLLKGANPRFSLGAQYDIRNRVTMNVNYTYDITSSLAPLNRISVSLKTHLGDRGRSKIQDEIDEYYLMGIDYYTSGNLDMAIELWEKALQLDKRYDPVKMSLKAAQDTRRVEQKMLDLQKID